MKGRALLAGIFLLTAAGAGYLAAVTWRAGADGKWLFAVFAVFFLVLAGAVFAPAKSQPPPTTTDVSSRFAPHWVLLGGTVVVVLAIIWAVVTAILAP